MKLPIKKKFFDEILAGGKVIEFRDAHITFTCEETGRRLRAEVRHAEVINKIKVNSHDREALDVESEYVIRFEIDRIRRFPRVPVACEAPLVGSPSGSPTSGSDPPPAPGSGVELDGDRPPDDPTPSDAASILDRPGPIALDFEPGLIDPDEYLDDLHRQLHPIDRMISSSVSMGTDPEVEEILDRFRSGEAIDDAEFRAICDKVKGIQKRYDEVLKRDPTARPIDRMTPEFDEIAWALHWIPKKADRDVVVRTMKETMARQLLEADIPGVSDPFDWRGVDCSVPVFEAYARARGWIPNELPKDPDRPGSTRIEPDQAVSGRIKPDPDVLDAGTAAMGPVPNDQDPPDRDPHLLPWEAPHADPCACPRCRSRPGTLADYDCNLLDEPMEQIRVYDLHQRLKNPDVKKKEIDLRGIFTRRDPSD